MKKRYTEEQIIGFLRDGEAGIAVKDLLPEAWLFRGQLLPVEVQVWRDVGLGCQAAQGTGNRERAIEEAAGRVAA